MVDRKALAQANAEAQSMRSKFWKIKEGAHKFRLIDVSPSIYFMDLSTHYQVGPDKAAIPCTKLTSILAKKSKKRCYLCDRVVALMAGSSAAEKAAGEAMRAQTKYLMNIYLRPTVNSAGGPVIAQFSKTIHDEIYDIIMNPEENDNIEILNNLSGHDLTMKRTGTTFKDTRYKLKISPKENALAESEEEIDAILADCADLSKFAVYKTEEQMKAALAGVSEDDEAAEAGDDDDEEEENEKPVQKKKKPAPVEDDEDEPEPPKKKKPAPAPVEEDEDEDEDDDEEEAPAPAKKKPAPKPADDEDEDEEEEADDDDEEEAPVKKSKPADRGDTKSKLSALRSRIGAR